MERYLQELSIDMLYVWWRVCLIKKRNDHKTKEHRDRKWKSVIDLVIVSNDLMEYIDEIHVDDERTHVLTKNTKTKNGMFYSEGDHNVINTKSCWSGSQKEEKQLKCLNI